MSRGREVAEPPRAAGRRDEEEAAVRQALAAKRLLAEPEGGHPELPVHAPDVVRPEPGQRVRRRVEPAAHRRVVHEEAADEVVCVPQPGEEEKARVLDSPEREDEVPRAHGEGAAGTRRDKWTKDPAARTGSHDGKSAALPPAGNR